MEYLDINTWSLTTMYGSLQLTIAALVTMFIIFIRRVNTMIDMVATRVFDAYSRFKPGEENHNKELLMSMSQLKRFGDAARQRKAFQREIDKEIRDKYLFELKENHVAVASVNRRPLTGLSCYNCCPNSRESLVNKATRSLSVINLFTQQKELKDGYDAFLQRFCGDLLRIYSVKKFDYPRVEGTVLEDERLKNAVERTASEQFNDINTNDEIYYQKLVKNNEKRGFKLLYDMRSTLSDFLLRFTSWVLYKLLPLFLNSIIVHPGQVEMLNKASESGLPMIFIPLHRSHLDYIMVSFILLNNSIRSPLVAAGDNLRIPFFGSLLRGLGAFYIKRRMDPVMGRKDHIYKAVLHTYMNECLRAGHNIEFFLEGGRTRTGKPCMPKYGIFSVIIEAFMDGTIEDALLVPISMNYEKLIDGNFVREQLGEPKKMETFGMALKSIWNVLNSNYGMMRIDFNQPFSLRELIKTFNTSGKVQPTNGLIERLRSSPSTTSLYGTDVVAEEHKQLVQSISKHVLFDCVQSTAIMSTNAVAFLLLNRFRNGATIDDISNALDELRIELRQSGKDIGFSGDSIDVINYAVELLGPGLVRIETKENEEEIIKPVVILPNVIELSYYSNCLMQHFVLKSVIATALSVLDMSSGYVREEALLQHCLEICDILQFEFIFCKPCQTIESAIANTIDEFIMRDEIFLQNSNSVEYERSRKLAEELLGDDVVEEKPIDHQIRIDEKTTKHIKFLRDLLKPWIECYSWTAFTLEKVVGETTMENEMIKNVIAEMKRQYLLGHVLYGESVCADPIKNALKLFQQWDILECHSEEKVRLIYLRDQHDNTESVKRVYDRINKYRVAI